MGRGRGEERARRKEGGEGVWLKRSPWLTYWGCWERCVSPRTILIDGKGSHCEKCVKEIKRWRWKSCVVVMAQAPGWGIEEFHGRPAVISKRLRKGSVRLNKFRGEVHCSESPLQTFTSQLCSLGAITKMTSTTVPLWALVFCCVKPPTTARQCVWGWGYSWPTQNGTLLYIITSPHSILWEQEDYVVGTLSICI